MSAPVRETLTVEQLPGASVGPMIRIARYSVYPREAGEHAVQTGFTRSGRGDSLELVTSDPQAVGALLRVEIEDLGQRHPCDTLARVIDCKRSQTGRFELTLEALDARRPRFVRPEDMRVTSSQKAPRTI